MSIGLSYTPDEIKWTHRVRELPGLEGATVREMRGAVDRRWRVYNELVLSLDGTTENGVKTEALISSGATPIEALTAAHNWHQDPSRMGFYRDRLIRGQRLDTEPFPLSEAEEKQREANRERAKKIGEIATEGARKHLHNQLAMMGLLDKAKRYHRKTGRLRMLFDKVFG